MNEISKENMELPTRLSKKMNTQNKRCTAYPIFVIQIDVKEYGDRSWCSETERKEVYDTDGMCEECKKEYNETSDSNDWCGDCDEECFVWYNKGTSFDLNAGAFFTAEACEVHIAQNGYHYNNPQSFAIGAWRNPEMEKVMDIISGLTTDDKNLLK